MRFTILSALVVVLLAVAPASAEEPAEAVDLTAVAAAPAATPATAEPQADGSCGWPDLAPALAGDPQPNISGTCTATCWDGSSRTCDGSSCSAVDSNCPNQTGYCWSDLEGYKFCPACPEEDCEHDGEPCVKDLQCGTCFGFQCVCRGTVGNKHCICP